MLLFGLKIIKLDELRYVHAGCRFPFLYFKTSRTQNFKDILEQVILHTNRTARVILKMCHQTSQITKPACTLSTIIRVVVELRNTIPYIVM